MSDPVPSSPDVDITHRIVAGVVVVLLPFLNALLAKYGLPSLDGNTLAAVLLSVIGIVIVHGRDIIHARSVAAASAAAPTPAAAVLDLAKGPTP